MEKHEAQKTGIDFTSSFRLLLDVAEKIHNLGNQISSMNFADDRNYLSENEISELKNYKDEYDGLVEKNSFLFQKLEKEHWDEMKQFYGEVIELLKKQKEKSEKESFEEIILKSLIDFFEDRFCKRDPKYDIWWALSVSRKYLV
ncbi:MAG TPA: hypothetical protein DHW82_09140 [Spirochaetia bacterium]|nr:hypothetical protein [Spirochaetia bacterium]